MNHSETLDIGPREHDILSLSNNIIMVLSKKLKLRLLGRYYS
jgi:hypothetical protein